MNKSRTERESVVGKTSDKTSTVTGAAKVSGAVLIEQFSIKHYHLENHLVIRDFTGKGIESTTSNLRNELKTK